MFHLKTGKAFPSRKTYIERLIHNTKNRKAVYNFDQKFYKFPFYLMRAAIAEALGNVQAYMSNIDSWVKNECRGAKPKLDRGGHVLPCLYRKGMYKEGFGDEAYIKVYRNNDWVWQKIRLNHSNTVTSLAHQNGMRISHICAWNTSRLAYDGSGEVLRGNKVSDTTPYDMCKFQSGKMYNCDLSASYNIGARYFARELIKELPDIMAEVPDIGSGTTRTLSTLWKINSAMPI